MKVNIKNNTFIVIIKSREEILELSLFNVAIVSGESNRKLVETKKKILIVLNIRGGFHKSRNSGVQCFRLYH